MNINCCGVGAAALSLCTFKLKPREYYMGQMHGALLRGETAHIHTVGGDCDRRVAKKTVSYLFFHSELSNRLRTAVYPMYFPFTHTRVQGPMCVSDYCFVFILTHFDSQS